MGQQCSTFYRRLTALLAEKWNESYSSTLSWIRCLLSFCLLRSAIQCTEEPVPPVAMPSSPACQSTSYLTRLKLVDFFFFCVILVHHSPTVYPIIFLPFSSTVLDCIFISLAVIGRAHLVVSVVRTSSSQCACIYMCAFLFRRVSVTVSSLSSAKGKRERASCPRICASSSVVRPREREATETAEEREAS